MIPSNARIQPYFSRKIDQPAKWAISAFLVEWQQSSLLPDAIGSAVTVIASEIAGFYELHRSTSPMKRYATVKDILIGIRMERPGRSADRYQSTSCISCAAKDVRFYGHDHAAAQILHKRLISKLFVMLPELTQSESYFHGLIRRHPAPYRMGDESLGGCITKMSHLIMHTSSNCQLGGFLMRMMHGKLPLKFLFNPLV